MLSVVTKGPQREEELSPDQNVPFSIQTLEPLSIIQDFDPQDIHWYFSIGKCLLSMFYGGSPIIVVPSAFIRSHYFTVEPIVDDGCGNRTEQNLVLPRTYRTYDDTE